MKDSRREMVKCVRADIFAQELEAAIQALAAVEKEHNDIWEHNQNAGMMYVVRHLIWRKSDLHQRD